jgi:Rhodanese-like domain
MVEGQRSKLTLQALLSNNGTRKRARRVGSCRLECVKTDTEEARVVATISREDLKAKLDRGDDFFLVETLSEKQYRHAHLPSAINLPPDRVRELAPEVLPDKDADIVVYCGSPQ